MCEENESTRSRKQTNKIILPFARTTSWLLGHSPLVTPIYTEQEPERTNVGSKSVVTTLQTNIGIPRKSIWKNLHICPNESFLLYQNTDKYCRLKFNHIHVPKGT